MKGLQGELCLHLLCKQNYLSDRLLEYQFNQQVKTKSLFQRERRNHYGQPKDIKAKKRNSQLKKRSKNLQESSYLPEPRLFSLLIKSLKSHKRKQKNQVQKKLLRMRKYNSSKAYLRVFQNERKHQIQTVIILKTVKRIKRKRK